MLSSGGSADDAWPDDAVEVGRIVDAWGVKGWFKVQPFAAEPQALFSSRRWHLQPPEDRVRRAAALPALLRIIAAREQGAAVVAQAQEVADRGTAESLRGARVFVSRRNFPTAAPDEFYWVDLIGLAVVNRAGHCLGQVAGLIDTGAHSVLRVQGAPDVDETLIPFVAAYVDSVDLAQRRIAVDWGLDY
jgi:16S rRNA processing protein RimM